MTDREIELIEQLKQFDPVLLDVAPRTERDLMVMYVQHSNILYSYLRETVNQLLIPLTNELRAFLGHIATYRTLNPTQSKRELDKAYGHFRRFTIDALKILCDENDKCFLQILKKEYTYDFRSVSKDYLEQFSRRYFQARRLYLEAQVRERVGSDYKVHNLIELYYKAARAYIDLRQYYHSYAPQVRKIKFRMSVRKCVKWAMVLVGIISSLCGLIEVH